MPTKNDPVFHKYGQTYIAEYLPDDGSSTHGGEWRLFVVTYHKTRNGKPVKAKKQAPRFKRLGYFSSLQACKDHLKIIENKESTGDA